MTLEDLDNSGVSYVNVSSADGNVINFIVEPPSSPNLTGSDVPDDSEWFESRDINCRFQSHSYLESNIHFHLSDLLVHIVR